jgi:hypothetical protein
MRREAKLTAPERCFPTVSPGVGLRQRDHTFTDNDGGIMWRRTMPNCWGCGHWEELPEEIAAQCTPDAASAYAAFKAASDAAGAAEALDYEDAGPGVRDGARRLHAALVPFSRAAVEKYGEWVEDPGLSPLPRHSYRELREMPEDELLRLYREALNRPGRWVKMKVRDS